jgi:hypothetical protein
MLRMVAALVVAVVLAGVFVYLQPSSTPTPQPRPPSQGAVNVPDPPPVDSERWRSAFPLEQAEARADGDTPAARELAKALEPYRVGDYQRAASELERVWADHPGEYRAALYLGVSRLFLDEAPSAIEVLSAAQSSPDPAVVAAVQWYSLVGIARLRDPSAAIPGIRDLCRQSAEFSARACKALDVLGIAR